MNIDNYDIFGEIAFNCAHDWEFEPFDDEPDTDQTTHAWGVWACLYCGAEDEEREEPCGQYDYGDEVI